MRACHCQTPPFLCAPVLYIQMPFLMAAYQLLKLIPAHLCGPACAAPELKPDPRLRAASPALRQVSPTCAPPRLGALLRRASDLLAMGADPDTAWQAPEGHEPDGCEALSRLARRSASSGSALAHGVAELAEQSRQDARHTAAAAAERAGVLIAGPLGLCFLPAFVCLGIVPVVAGLAGDIFGSGLL